MAEQKDWAFPAEMRPKPEDWRFDLEQALDAVVLVRSEIPEDAFTASILGTERAGNGVVISENGLVLTIGYLITEASVIWLATNKGTVVGGYPMAYDQATGFGLVQPLGKLGVKPIERGSASSIRVGENVVVAGHGGRAHALKATVFAKREFAGYWEYVLDEALFTAPAHPQWGGSALIGADGKLAGMTKTGRANRAPHPWLGMYATEAGERLVVAGLAPGAPAERAGVRVGDAVIEVGGEKPKSLADLWRKVWAHGAPGAIVPLKLARSGKMLQLSLTSADRADFLKKPHLH